MGTDNKKKIRVLFTRNLFEGHDVGLRTVVNQCRDSGMEVVYYPRFNEFTEVIKVAEQEDVDLIGISSSSAGHFYIAKQLLALLKENNMDIPLIFGGVFPDSDVPKLKEMGVKGVFGPGSSPLEVANFIHELLD
ncbi:MAG: cobalamin-dependent protein [Syntrophales bacterium]